MTQRASVCAVDKHPVLFCNWIAFAAKRSNVSPTAEATCSCSNAFLLQKQMHCHSKYLFPKDTECLHAAVVIQCQLAKTLTQQSQPSAMMLLTVNGSLT